MCTITFLLTIWTVNNEFVAENSNFKFDERFDAIATAAAVGRLDIVAMILTFIGVVGAFSIIYGWTAFRSVSIDAAKAETIARLPIALEAHLTENGADLIKTALQDIEMVARLQARFAELGIDETEQADIVDDDATWKEEAA